MPPEARVSQPTVSSAGLNAPVLMVLPTGPAKTRQRDVDGADFRNGCGLHFHATCPEWPLIVRLLLWATRSSRR